MWINDHNKLFAEAETGGYRKSGLGRLHGYDALIDFHVRHARGGVRPRHASSQSIWSTSAPIPGSSKLPVEILG